MDALRFDELKHSIAFGGLPDISKETFTADQVKELTDICKERSAKSLEYAKTLKTVKEDTK